MTIDATTTTEDEFAQYVPLAYRLAASYVRARDSWYHDLVSAALVRVWKAARTHDPARGELEHYIHYLIHCACQDEWRKRARLHTTTISLEAPDIKGSDPGECFVELTVCDTPIEQAETIARCLARLSPLHYKVVVLVYFQGARQCEVAKALNRTEPAVSKIHRRALAKMRGAV